MRFAVCPEAIGNTLLLSERLEFTGPEFGIVMPPDATSISDMAVERLRKAAYDGAVWHYGELSEAVVKRLSRRSICT